ncbi:hypothetical protein [Variovorax sp. YR752]|uniref:hypothetical protein n=1 Tax=Variovorax sp. YR752 TaxID=1884383 RepID=UPI0031384A09
MDMPKPVDPSTTISRYVSFATFLSIVRTRKMYFPAAGTFSDKHEGSGTVIDEMHLDGLFDALHALVNYRMTASLGIGVTPERRETLKAEAEAIEKRRRTIQTPFGALDVTPERKYRQILAALRLSLDVSCWHENIDESLAMWKIYGGSAESVCIRSTVGALDSALQLEPDARKVVARVKYIDHQQDWFEDGHAFSSVTHKQKPYSFEQEVRAIVWNPGSDPFEPRAATGSLVDIDLHKLVTSIRLSPEAQPWFRALVAGVVADDLKVEIEQSIISRDPIL